METLEYKASMDTFALIVTIAVIILFIAIGQNSIRNLLRSNSLNTTSILIHSGILVLLITILLSCFLYSPQKYEIKENTLIVKRPIGNKAINLNNIIDVRKIEEGEMSGTIRTFGVGGLFGYFGKFHNSTFGNMRYYATQRDNMVLLRSNKDQKIVISPDDIGMVNKLKEIARGND